MSKIVTKKITILKLTVAEKETVQPGDVLEVPASDAAILINSKKAKEYEKGDEEKYKVAKKAPKAAAKKDA